MLLWHGSCVVHDEFKADELAALSREHPQAAILVHPESPAGVAALADVVGSTTQLIAAAGRLDADTFIVATDQGILHDMRQRHRARPSWPRPPPAMARPARAARCVLDGDERAGRRGAGPDLGPRRNHAGSGHRAGRAPAHRTHAGFRRRGSPAGAQQRRLRATARCTTSARPEDRSMHPESTDVLVIGAGLAGMATALSLPPHLRVAMLSKGPADDCASAWAQGGIAAAQAADDSIGRTSRTRWSPAPGCAPPTPCAASWRKAPRRSTGCSGSACPSRGTRMAARCT